MAHSDAGDFAGSEAPPDVGGGRGPGGGSSRPASYAGSSVGAGASRRRPSTTGPPQPSAPPPRAGRSSAGTPRSAAGLRGPSLSAFAPSATPGPAPPPAPAGAGYGAPAAGEPRSASPLAPVPGQAFPHVSPPRRVPRRDGPLAASLLQQQQKRPQPQRPAAPGPAAPQQWVGPCGAAEPAERMFPPARSLGTFQSVLHTALGAAGTDADALHALQGDVDPLLESVDPFLAAPSSRPQGAATPALQRLQHFGGRLSPRRGVQPQQPGVVTPGELERLGEADLRRLVESARSGPAGAGQPVGRVDTSPPPAPARGRARDPVQAVAELENRLIQKAAREMLDEQLEGMDVRRRALAAYYAGSRDMDFTDFLHDFVAENARGRDPVQLMQLQAHAMVDPFVGNKGLGLPETIDSTRVPPQRAPLFPAVNQEWKEGDDDVERHIEDEGDPEWVPQGPVTQPLQQEAVWGARRALLVGVTYARDGPTWELPRSANSVHRTRAHLAEMGFRGEQLVLTDADPMASPETLPTHSNLNTAMRWLVDGARAGDSLFLYFVGRAQYVVDEIPPSDPRAAAATGQQPRESPQLLPCDHAEYGGIDGDLLFEEVIRPLAEGVRLTCVIDCCAYGTVFDLPYQLIAQPGGSFRVTEGVKERRGCRGQVVMLCCARDPEAERRQLEDERLGQPPPLYEGALTDAFLQAIARDPRPTYRDLLVRMRAALRSRLGPHAHAPCVSATAPADWRRMRWHLAAPQVSAEDDARLVEARQQTRGLEQELREMEAAQELAAERMRRLIEERRAEEAKRREEEWEEECRLRAEEERRLQGELQRMRRQDAERRLDLCLTDEEALRMRQSDEEAQARHRLTKRFTKQAGDILSLPRSRQSTKWCRQPAEEGPGPVVLGVRWQRGDEAPAGPRALEQRFGGSAPTVRDFNVIHPPRIEKPSLLTGSPRSDARMQRLLGIPAQQGHQQQTQHGPGTSQQLLADHATAAGDALVRWAEQQQQQLAGGGTAGHYPPSQQPLGAVDPYSQQQQQQQPVFGQNAPIGGAGGQQVPPPALADPYTPADTPAVRWRRVDQGADVPQWVREEVPPPGAVGATPAAPAGPRVHFEATPGGGYPLDGSARRW